MTFLTSSSVLSLPTGNFLLMSNLKYDEMKIVDTVKEGNEEELGVVALQLAIHGFGNKQYGQVTIEGVVKEVTQIFDENNVKYDLAPGTNLDPEDLTPKRLTRVYRYHIHDYIRQNRVESYMYRKYCENGSPEYVFPGAEYMVESGEHAENLLDVYANMDERNGTHFVEKIKQIYKSRGVVVEEDEE